MSEQIKARCDLNTVTHSVRGAQAVLQYGVGAMVDFPDQILVTAAPEYWRSKSYIYDERFAKALKVDYFALPTDIAYVRFPEWYFCPRCRRFQPLKKWVAEHRASASAKIMKYNPYMTKYLRCTKCKQDLVASRIVTVCPDGHLNDFPWVEWAHVQAGKQICEQPELRFETSGAGTEGLEGLGVRCSCGASTTLRGAFDSSCFERMGSSFQCRGHHPFRHVKEECSCYPKTVQRGASSVYFPVVYSSLVIPPYADKLNTEIEQSHEFERCMTKKEVYEEDCKSEREVSEAIAKHLPAWAGKIASEIAADASDVEKILRRKWLSSEGEGTDIAGVGYRAEEYSALSGDIGAGQSSALGDFSREDTDITEYNIPHVKAISLIDKVRVVNALVGFSRIEPVVKSTDKGFVSVKEKDTNWYPAYEVRGEGIFIEFKQEDIEEWVRRNPQVIKRTNLMRNNYASTLIGKHHPRTITPKFVLLHTLSHLLITRLSFECGYSVASLSERIYCSEKAGDEKMAGIFIYTACGDAEGTLGGLVRQGRHDTFPKIFKKAVRGAKMCSNDPVCIMSGGQGRDSLNLAACHACALLPETCCEERNAFLDRGLIVGTYENPDIGFWKDL